MIFRDRDLAQLTEREWREMRGHHIGLVRRTRCPRSIPSTRSGAS